ncbi:MAG: FCD domain-containing protein [Sneathiellaceae bacterium]
MPQSTDRRSQGPAMRVRQPALPRIRSVPSDQDVCNVIEAEILAGRLQPGDLRRLGEAHRTILEALRAGDADVAERWMVQHVADFRRGCMLAGIDAEEVVDAPGA